MTGTSQMLDKIIDSLSNDKGVILVKLLSENEKQEILTVEHQVEERIVFGMCKSLNQGVREALNSKFAVAMIIHTSEFQYPHHPHMRIMWDDQIVGEQIKDEKKVEELKKDRFNFFLWDTFVIYVKKLPKKPEERAKIRFVYYPRTPVQLQSMPSIQKGVFGTPSTEGDILIKKMLNVECDDVETGTCLIGFELNSSSK